MQIFFIILLHLFMSLHGSSWELSREKPACGFSALKAFDAQSRGIHGNMPEKIFSPAIKTGSFLSYGITTDLQKQFMPRKEFSADDIKTVEPRILKNTKRKRELISLAVFICCFIVIFYFILQVFRQQVRELDLPETERVLLKSIGTSGAHMGVSSKEGIYVILEKADEWVSAGRVALTAGITQDEAEKVLNQLLADGRIKSGRDDDGDRHFKVI